MVSRVSSNDSSYITGQLSNFPTSLDTQYQLYTATNNSQTVLSQSLTYSGKYVIVEDNSTFPSNGILRVGPPPGQPGVAEMIYYDNKTPGTFKNLIRGFAGSRQNPWPIGSYVSNAVSSQYHNTVKDAILNIEADLGIETLPNPASLNGILKSLETRFLSPIPLFRAFPLTGTPPLAVRFQNFSTGPLIKYLWDFGDGSTSVEKSPIHTFTSEGIYTVQLSIVTALGAQGYVTKSNYITVNIEDSPSFFYVTPNQGYSAHTASKLTALGNPTSPTTFQFVDQTDGDIIQRYWVFGGAGKNNNTEVPTQSIEEDNPNIHYTNYTYDVPGVYQPSLLILFENQNVKRAFLQGEITVL